MVQHLYLLIIVINDDNYDDNNWKEVLVVIKNEHVSINYTYIYINMTINR